MVALSKSRIEALSDGVFSIAMTLLVLKLEVPEHHHSNEEMLRQLLDLQPQFVSYVVTFLIAGGFWFLHHLTFHFIRHVNGFLVWVNLIFLMFVSLLPFSAGLLGHLLVHPVSQVFYIGNQLAIALLLNVHWQYARRRGFIGEEQPADSERLTFRIAHAAAIFLGCLITAVFFPAYTWMTFLVLLVGGLIVEWRAWRKPQRS